MTTNRKYKYQPHRIPRHHSECRSGNARLKYINPNYDPIADPNSSTHERNARRLSFELWKKLDGLTYDAWMLRTHKPNATWLDIELAAQEALVHPETLDCTCKLPEEHCPICDSAAHTNNLEDFVPDVSIGNV